MADCPVECGYCCVEFEKMDEPRRLPCDHVCCLRCLKEDYRAGGCRIKCPFSTCGEVHKDLDLDSLPEIEEATAKPVKEPSFPPMACRHKSNCVETAVCFCKDCGLGLAMCLTHKQAHDDFLGDSHTYVPYDEYRRFPKKYEKPACLKHAPKPLSMACSECDQLVCEECDHTSTCGTYAGTSHKFISLTKLEKKFREEYDEVISRISEKHGEFSKKVKNTGARFDYLVASYGEEDKLRTVDKEADRQITEIRRRAKLKKKDIKRFPQNMDSEVKTYTEELQRKENQLEDLHQSLSRLLRNSHIAEVIRQNKDNKIRVNEAEDLETGDCNILREMVVVPTGLIRDIDVQLRPLIPKALVKFDWWLLTKVEKLTITDQCHLLYCTDDGNVVIMDTYGKQKIACKSIDNVRALRQSKDRVFVVSYVFKQLTCTSYDYQLLNEKTICHFHTGSPNSNSCAVTDDRVILIDNSSYNYQLHIYTHDGTHIHSVKLDEELRAVWSLPDGNVLIRDCSGVILKCDITDCKVTKQWENCWSKMTVDGSSGLSYQSAGEHKKQQRIQLCHVESGEIVGDLLTEERKRIDDLSIKDNILAVTDGDSRLTLYYITY